MHRARAGMLTCLAVALLATPAARAADTTTSRTIQDRDRDNRLEPAPGEDHVLRDDLATPSSDRGRTREERLFFGQMTDTHVVDEESPLRVEFLDKFGPPFTSAYRPQESLSAQVLESMVDQLRNTTSPVTHRKLDLVMTTGDNSDNTQLNETRWMIDTMDGETMVDPDSGVPSACNPQTGRHYQGVRGNREYYEPDSSDGEDGPGYSPRQAENEATAQRSSEVRDFDGLFDGAQEPFRATGLDLPWYAVFGNHDALIQGNQPRNPALESYATGCLKVTGANDATQASAEAAVAAVRDDPPNLPDPANLAARDAAYGSAFDGAAPTVLVQGDVRRRPLPKADWMAEHFATGGTPVGHGFANAPVPSMGYYAFAPRPGVRFVVLDSIAETGGDGGNLDPTQFNWIHSELSAADAAEEVAFLFAHHSLRTMNQGTSPFAAGDTGGDLTLAELTHFGQNPGEDDNPALCPQNDPAEPPLPKETLRCLMLRHPSVVAFVNGHEHNNRIMPVRRAGSHGLWEINTASHIDWPQQSRVLDLVNNEDGTLSIFTTIIDHAAGPNPGGGHASSSARRLASTSRELSYNDPDSSNGEDGRGDARGTPADRNTELVVADPWSSSGG